MKAMVKWPKVLWRSVALTAAVALILATTAGFAFALLDEFGGASFTAPYAPYTAGPVVREETRPYAPYTAGPVVREDDSRPYAPYTAGPVVREDEPEPYAPYTAGPVVREDPRPYAPYTAGPVVSEDEPVPERIGNYLLR